MKPHRRLRITALLVALVAATSVVIVASGWCALGRLPRASQIERFRNSLQWEGDGFENIEPMHNDFWQALLDLSSVSSEARPSSPVATVQTDPNLFTTAPASGLRVTWFGHSSILIELDGTRLLVDPFWGERAPFPGSGRSAGTPRRLSSSDCRLSTRCSYPMTITTTLITRRFYA